MRPVTVVVLAFVLLAPSPSLASPPVPACTRVLPGIGFPRKQLLDPATVTLAAKRGRDGERGLVLVRFDRLTLYSLQLAAADGKGGLALGPRTALPQPDWTVLPRRAVAGDFNGDGFDDVAVLWSNNPSPSSVLELHLGRPDGSFAAAARWEWQTGSLWGGAVAGDFDADSRIDLAFIAPWQPDGRYPELQLIGFDAAGQPVVRSSTPLPGYASDRTGPAVVDWNEDGIDDVAFLQSQGQQSAVGIAFGDRERPLTTRVTEFVGYYANQLRSVDRKLIALEGHMASPSVAIHQPIRGTTPCEDAFRIALSAGAGVLHASIDLDGDGYQELLGSGYDGLGFDVYWGQASGTPAAGPRSVGSPAPLASLDLDGDGVRDLVFDDFGAVLQSREARVDEGLRGAIVNEDRNAWFMAALAIGDLDEDGLEDAITWTRVPESFALARSTGDGGFDVRPFEETPFRFSEPQVRDLDGDGHLDLAAFSSARAVAWGRGDGTFAWDVPPPIENHYVSRYFGRLDSDDALDAIEVVTYSNEPDRCHLRTALGGGRRWRDTAVDDVLRLDEYTRTLAIADLDGDGRDDLVLAHRRSATEQDLVWRRSLGDGSFGAAMPIEGSATPGPIVRITPADFDLDGTLDLFEQATGNGSEPPATNISLRNAGAGRFERAWSSGTIPFENDVSDRLADVDGDGRPDLVRGMYDASYWQGRYVLNVRRGDGLGGFLPPEPTTWAGPAGPTARFRSSGVRDIVRLHERDQYRFALESLPGTGHVLAADEAPPVVELTLLPIVDTSRTPPRFDSRWRVATVPIDECDSSPRVVQRVVALLPLAAEATVTYRRAAVNEVRVYEVPNTARREVLLLGPNEAALRRAFDAARTAGGLAFEHFGTLQLESHDTYGTERGPRLGGSRLAQRFVLDGERLVTALETRPGDGLTFAVDATDAAGHRGTTRVRLDVVRDAAMGKVCANPELAPYLCVK